VPEGARVGVSYDTSTSRFSVTGGGTIVAQGPGQPGTSMPGGAGSPNALLNVAPGSVYLKPNGSVKVQNGRKFSALRHENGGVVLQRGVYIADTDTTGPEGGAEVGYSLGVPLLGDRTRLDLLLNFGKGVTEDHVPSIPANGNTLGVADPFGGGFAFGAGDITNLNFRHSMKDDRIELLLYEEFDFPLVTFTAVGGAQFNLSHSMSNLMFRTNAGFTDVEREDQIDSLSFGPVFGGYVSKGFGGVTLFGGGYVSPLYTTVDGSQRLTLSNPFFNRARDTSETSWRVAANGTAGVRFNLTNKIILEGSASVTWRNDEAYFDNQDNQLSKLKFDSNVGSRFGVGLILPF